MEESSTTLDCRGLTPALTVLRVKQAISSSKNSDDQLRVMLGPGCVRENVSNALGEFAGRIQYVTSDPGLSHVEPAEPTRSVVYDVLDGEHSDSSDTPSTEMALPWWQRRDLRYRDGRLYFGEVGMNDLATQVGTPAYVYRAARIKENIRRLSGAMSSADIEHRIYYALKANRSSTLLTYMRTLDLCGVDVCSADELMHALCCGFPAEAISFTGTSLSSQDIEVISRFKKIHVNFDSLSSLDKFGRACPGSEVGLRINPGIGVGYQGNERLNYSGTPTTKFGIYREQLEEAKAIAARWNLRIVRVHFHVGCGYLDTELDQLGAALDAANAFTEFFAELREVNLGGGLGVPHSSVDKPLDLQRWAMAIARRFASRGLIVAVEPGDYLVKDAGLLLTTVTYVESRRDVLFAGLDAGFNLAMEPAFYGLPCEPVAVAPRWDEGTKTYTVVGNINEALDKWAVDHRMPRLQEGDYVALLNSGGYASSMRSDHCLRGQAREIVLIDHDLMDGAPTRRPRLRSD